MKLIKPNIINLSEYNVEQNHTCVKLNQNESPLDISTAMKKEVLEKLLSESWNRYPAGDAIGLKTVIADYADVPVNNIVVGNGSNEMIQTVLYAACDSGDSIVTIHPGFSIYKRIASIMNIAVQEVPLQPDFSFDLDSLTQAGRKAKMMIIAVPNNPTGTTLTALQIRRLAEEFKGLLVLDEAYFEFSHETALESIREMEHVIILRTFSKALGSAGLRLGYMMGKETIIKDIYKARLPFSVGNFQQIAGEIILRNRKWWKSQVDKIITERDRVFKELTQLEGVYTIPSKTNFILFETLNIPARKLYEKLFARGVLVRWFDIPELENMLRVTIGTVEENEIFLDRLKEILQGGKNEPNPV